MATVRLRFSHLRDADAVFRSERGHTVALPAALFTVPLHESVAAELHVTESSTESEHTRKVLLNQLLHGELPLPSARNDLRG